MSCRTVNIPVSPMVNCLITMPHAQLLVITTRTSGCMCPVLALRGNKIQKQIWQIDAHLLFPPLKTAPLSYNTNQLFLQLSCAYSIQLIN